MCLCLVEASTQQTDPEELGDTVSAVSKEQLNVLPFYPSGNPKTH